MKNPYIIFGIIIALGAGIFWTSNSGSDDTDSGNTNSASGDTHIHAAFHLYEDNRLADFTDLQYQKIAPCSAEDHDERDEELTAEEEQIEKAHLHDSVGDVVHVHRPGAVWGDLFLNIGAVPGPPINGYVNGEFVTDLLAHPIEAYDRVLILAGENNSDDEAKLAALPTKEHIEEVEAQGENCSN